MSSTIAADQHAEEDWHERLEQAYGLKIGADYNLLYQHYSEGAGPTDAFGGVARLYGEWTPMRYGNDSGGLVFKVENRHRIGTEITPSQIASFAGYAGTTGPTFSDAASILTNLYWRQTFFDKRFAYVAGIVDASDYFDVYALNNQWTDFNDQTFSTNPTIPAPSQGLGAAFLVDTDHYYLVAGIADANGNPSNPGDAFHSFFDTAEYFTHLEVGWFESWDTRFTDNIHVSLWHADERITAGVDGGWGTVFSWNRMFGERWMPFLRAGYSEGGGALVERAVATGFGYKVNDRGDFFGIGIGWGRPGNGKDQYTTEAYYRLQLTPKVFLVPSVEYIRNPALNREIDDIWVTSIKFRAAL